MGKKREKYINSLEHKKQKTINAILHNIRSGNWGLLDIKPVAGKEGRRRCRTGKLRILFEKQGEYITIKKILPRGDVYQS